MSASAPPGQMPLFPGYLFPDLSNPELLSEEEHEKQERKARVARQKKLRQVARAPQQRLLTPCVKHGRAQAYVMSAEGFMGCSRCISAGWAGGLRAS